MDIYVKDRNDISPHVMYFCYNHFKSILKQDTKYLLQSRVPSLTHGGLHVNNVSTSKRRQYFYHLKISL